MIYWEVIYDIVWVKPKHGKKLCGDFKISKQDFRAFKKLTQRMLHGMGPTDWVDMWENSLAVNGQSVISGIKLNSNECVVLCWLTLI